MVYDAVWIAGIIILIKLIINRALTRSPFLFTNKFNYYELISWTNNNNNSQ